MHEREEERLEAVNRFLNLKTTKDADLQAIVSLAADICDVPTALITLVGKDLQYIQYKKGFYMDSTRREDAFCNHVVNDGYPVIVPDATKDPRFSGNRLVRHEPGICFYAGIPLTTRDGLHLGSLCVIDRVPGTLSSQQQRMLEILAGQIVQLLEYEASREILQEQFAKAKDEEIKMMSFFHSLGCAHMLLDKEFKVLAFNKNISSFIYRHYNTELHVGEKVLDVINDDLSEAFTEFCARASRGEVIRRERHLKYPDIEYWWEVCYEPAYGTEGEIIGVSFNAIDVSAKVKSMQTQKQREQMLNSIAFAQAHGLRRPVSSIKGLLNMLDSDGVLHSSANLHAMKVSVDFIDQKIHEIIRHTHTAPDAQ